MLHLRTAVLAVALASCGCTAEIAKDRGKSGDLTSPPGPAGNGHMTPGIGVNPPVPLFGDCSYEQELMFVLGTESNTPGPATLYSFDPPTMTAKKIAALSGCPEVDADRHNWPMAMSIDVEGTAWVLFVYGHGLPGKSFAEIYQVDTTTGDCTDAKVSFKGPSDSWIEGGLGFIGPAYGTDKDRLFLGGVFTELNAPPGLLSLDPRTLTLATVGPFGGAPAGFWPSRVTGTGDGRLYAFSGAQWAEIDPTSGKLKTALNDLKLPSDHFPGSAIAYWGEDFWIFEGDGLPGDSSSTIYRHELATKLTSEEGTFPSYVTAAGVTTCAPTAPR
jgi:hypothetical protein